jgi:signal transduction histidine kinase
VSIVEVDRLTQLAEDLLLIARFERGTLPLRVEFSDASELLGSVARRFEWRAQEDGRPLSTDVTDCQIWGDRLRLEQALGNLVDNALRHGEGEVRLSALAANGGLELHVTDEGDGFPPELLERAFERFTRGDQSRARGGAGLGLSIVQVVAEAHGGSAHAGPRAGGGADVWVALPAPQTAKAEPGV